MAADNVFGYLNDAGNWSGRTTQFFKTEKSSILHFPPGLGGTSLSGNTIDATRSQTIPFTLFAPYKRNRGMEGLYSTQSKSRLFENLPQPWFAIALPTPTSALKTSYQAVYAETSLGQGLGASVAGLSTLTAAGTVAAGVAGAAAGAYGASATDGALSLGTGAKLGALAGLVAASSTTKKAGDVLTVSGFMGIQDAMSKIPGSENSKDILNIMVGAANNPYTEQAFKNMQFRTHLFEYVFMPRNVQESQLIDQIIQLFKYTMMPQESAGIDNPIQVSVPGFPAPLPNGTTTGAGFFQFPYEFQITHSTQDSTFTLLPSVLSDLAVDYSGGVDSPKFFMPDKSTKKQFPARITLSMTFKEMVLLTRDRLDITTGDQQWLSTTGDADFRTSNSTSNVMRFRF